MRILTKIAVTEAAGFAEQRTSSYTFDSIGDLASTTNPRGVVTAYSYDTAGRVTGVTAASGTSDALTFTTAYDALDRTTKTTRPGNRVATVEYDALGQVTKTSDGVGTALARFRTMGYDLAGNLTSVTDPLNHTTTYGYNARNERTSITDALGGVTAFAFDKVGNLVSLTDPVNNTTTWAYDDAKRMSKRTDPRGKSTTYARDKNGNVTSITDRLGRVREYSFDANNRTTAETWKTSGGATVQTQTFGYDANGNLLTATDPDGNYAMSYDRFDRAVTVAQPFGVSQTFTYDANDNRLTASDNKGGVLTSGYDNLDRLTSRELGGTSVASMKASWAYDAAADVQTVTRQGKTGSSWATAGVTTFTHDDLGRTTNIRLADASNTTLSQYGYTIDAADRITAMTVNGTSRTFGYDATNQLTSDNGTSLTYDKNGNRTGGNYATAANNRLTSDGTWTYSYDDEGNATSKSSEAGTWNYSFDFRNQMTAASYTPTGGSTTKTVTQSFDAFGNRIERDATVGGVSSVEKFVVDGWDTTKPRAVGTENFDVAIDLDASGNVTNRRLFGAGFDELLGGQDGTGAVRWYGTDHLGSVRTVFDNSGTATNTVDYDAFGGFLGGVSVDRYAYTGREYDAITGLTHYRAREKDGHRFLSEDPKGFAAGDANLARYVGNSPTGRRDPSGQDFELRAAPQGVVPQPNVEAPSPGFFSRTWSFLTDNRLTRSWSGRQVDSLYKFTIDNRSTRFLGRVKRDTGMVFVWVGQGFPWTSYANRPLPKKAADGDNLPANLKISDGICRENKIWADDVKLNAGVYFLTGFFAVAGVVVAGPEQAFINWALARGLTVLKNGSQLVIKRGAATIAEAEAKCIAQDFNIRRNGALQSAKRDSGLLRHQHPDSVNHVPMTDKFGKLILWKDGKPIMTREYTYTRPDGTKVIIQEHSAGHYFGEGGAGDVGPHFNVRPPENPRTGVVPGTLPHYEYN